MVKLDDLTPPVSAPTTQPTTLPALPPQATTALAEAERRLAAKDLPGAIERLERAWGFAPRDPRICRQLGIAYAAVPNPGKARENLTLAIAARPDDLEALVLLGRLLTLERKSDQAILTLRKALRCKAAVASEPLTGEALMALGEALQQQGYWTASLECFAKLSEYAEANRRSYAGRPALRELMSRPELVLTRQGELMLLLHRPADASQLLERAYGRDRTQRATARLLMKALVEIKAYPRAEKLLLEMAGEPSQHAQMSALASSLCLSAGEAKMPQRIWQAFIAKNKIDDALAVSLARLADRLGDPQEGVAILKSTLAAMPGNPAATRMLAVLSAKAGRTDEALRLLATMVFSTEDPASDVREALHEMSAMTVAGKPALPPGVETEFAEAIRQGDSPEKPALHYVAGTLAASREKRALAAEQFRLALDARKEFFPAYEALAALYEIQRQKEQTDQLLSRLAKAAPKSYFPAYLQGKVLFLRGRYADAVSRLEDSRSINKEYAPTLVLLAKAYARLQDSEGEQKALQQAMKYAPQNPDLVRQLVEYCVSQRPPQYDEAQKLVDQFVEASGDSVASRAIQVELLWRMHNYGMARSLLQKLREDAPDDPDVELLSIRVEMLAGVPYRGSYDRTIQQLQALAKRDPQNIEVKQTLADLYLQTGQQVEAAALWGRMYKETGGLLSEVGRLYADVLIQAKQYGQAADVLEKLLSADPENVPFRIAYAGVLGKLKRYDDAKQKLQSWIKKDTDALELWQYRTRLLALLEEQNQYDAGQKLLDEWIQAASDEPFETVSGSEVRPRTLFRIQKLRLYVAASQFDKATDYADQWFKGPARDLAAHRALASLLLKAKAYARLVPLMERYIGEMPQWDLPRELTVVALIEEQKYAQALAIVEAWRKAPASTSAPAVAIEEQDRFNPEEYCPRTIVRLLILQQKYEEALRRVEEFLKGKPKDPDLVQLKSSCLSEMGRDDEAMTLLEDAEKSLEEAIRRDPQNPRLRMDLPGVCNSLGYMLADKGLELVRAEELITLALAFNRDSTAIQDSLAWVYYKQGRVREAADIFRKILAPSEDDEEAIGPEDAVIYDHAGDAFYRLGWVKKAREYWTAALEEGGKDRSPSVDTRRCLKETAAKLEALKKNKPPAVAPLGRGVKDEKQ
jgi:tetratricopeptide (TPR) repeat protein